MVVIAGIIVKQCRSVRNEPEITTTDHRDSIINLPPVLFDMDVMMDETLESLEKQSFDGGSRSGVGTNILSPRVREPTAITEDGPQIPERVATTDPPITTTDPRGRPIGPVMSELYDIVLYITLIISDK